LGKGEKDVPSGRPRAQGGGKFCFRSLNLERGEEEGRRFWLRRPGKKWRFGIPDRRKGLLQIRVAPGESKFERKEGGPISTTGEGSYSFLDQRTWGVARSYDYRKKAKRGGEESLRAKKRKPLTLSRESPLI